ncbi:Glucosylceramidase [Meloidogyne graminicola]|uniref:Glucosylceramidase n=1 Tax=Meloidogyne graminicola TaxID=189291 RepID=A0A8S9ZWI6_9BILA|nr:Glucosylceramidase [Meloidogyne graminicola]
MNKILNSKLAIILLLFFIFNKIKSDNKVIINPGIIHQNIDGFGGSSAWLGEIPDKGIDNIFGKLGLSILRLGMVDICNNAKWGTYRCIGREIQTAKKALKYGIKIFASPSTSPNSFKTNNYEIMGELKEDKYGDYVEYLQTAVDDLKKNGIPLYAMSLQSEPDFSPPYISIKWSPEQIAKFLKYNGRRIKGTKIMAPECAHFRQDYNDAILNDPAAAKNVDIMAWHMYGMQLVPQTKAHQLGKSAWMTEITNDGNDWKSFMETAKGIHDCMTIAEYNAYVYFWFKDSKYISLVDKNYDITPRGYILGQYAKFIRPNYVRIDATANPSTNIFVSAYKGGNKIIIVVVNNGYSNINQQFSIKSINSFIPYITSPNKNLSKEANIAVKNGLFSYSIPGPSVVTFDEIYKLYYNEYIHIYIHTIIKFKKK